MPQENFQDDTISFTGVKNFAKASLRSFFGFLAFVEVTFSRRRWLILLGFVLGMAVGYLYYLSRTPYYRVSMIVQYNELTKKTYAEMIGQLDRLVSRAKENQPLASELKIPESVSSTIISLDARNMNNELLSSDTSTRIFQTFRILADVTDNRQLGELQTSLVNYLNNSPYLKRKREEQFKIYTDRLAFIDRELQKLDSLKTEYNRFLATSKISATFYNNAFDPADIYAQSSQLASQREDLLRWLNIERNAISVIDGFKPIHTARSIPLLLALLAFGLVGALLAFLFGFMLELRKAVSH